MVKLGVTQIAQPKSLVRTRVTICKTVLLAAAASEAPPGAAIAVERES